MVSFEESIQVDLNNTYKRIAYIFSPEIFGLKIILKLSVYLGLESRLLEVFSIFRKILQA